MVALESVALSLAKAIVQKAAGAWIADRRTAEVSKKELRALLTPGFRRAAPEQRFLDVAASELASFGRNEFRGLNDGERAAALQAVHNVFNRADLTDRALFAVDLDAAKLARRLRAGQPRAKTAAGLGEVGGAFYDAVLDRCCELYVRAVVQVPTFAGRSLAEILTRLSDLPDQVAARVVNAWREAQTAVADPDGAVAVAGRPLEEVTDPFDLEVHRPVQPEGAPPGLPLLPPYLPREHDQVLGQVVRAAVGGRSGIAVLVGGSSTGKTRACWEALAPLRDRDPPWRLWHPIDPSRPDAALADLPGIGPRTVVWLNEAQLYLDPADAGLGERVAAGLRELLRDVGRAPVLVLATVWPGFWHTLTARPPENVPDPHEQARELLAGHDIAVPAAFTPAQMSQLARAADARMVLAARSAPDGAVIQFLAGAPELLARYRHAPPAAKALISAAMDARRLGMGPDLPQAFLEAAAPGYLTDAEWDVLGEDWLDQALAYTAVPCKGARGPLTRIRPRLLSGARHHWDQPASLVTAAGRLYRLADYLDQHGRAHRASQIPSAEFWSAAAAHAAPADQAALGDAAHFRGLYRAAAQLHKNAAISGNPRAALYLSHSPACLRADSRRAHWAAAHAPLDDPRTVAILLDTLRREQAAALLARDPAAHAPLDHPGAVASLLDSLRAAGAEEQAAALLARDPAAHATLDHPGAVASLLDSLREAGAPEQAAALLARDPAAHAPLDHPDAVASLLGSLRAGGRPRAGRRAGQPGRRPRPPRPPGRHNRLVGQPTSGRARTSRPPRWPAGPPPTPPSTTRTPWSACWTPCGASRPPRRWPATPPPTPPSTTRVTWPACWAPCGGRARKSRPPWPACGRRARTSWLPRCWPAIRPPTPPSTTRAPWPVCWTACGRRARKSRPPRWPAGPPPTPPSTTRTPWPACCAACGRRARKSRPPRCWPATPPPTPPSTVSGGVASLLDSLREAGAHEQAAALLARDPAAHATLDHPGGVASLLDSLERAGAREQAAALASRAAHASLHPNFLAVNWRSTGRLIDRLREAGACEQAAALASQLPAAGMFEFFLEQQGSAGQFRFGREADGIPAAPWGWDDLLMFLS